MSLTKKQIRRLVNDYIGVDGGYLGVPIEFRFSYPSHKEFYPYYCDLDINPDRFGGTTRQRFMGILFTATAKAQAKIIRGVFEKIPPDLNLDWHQDDYRELEGRIALRKEYLKLADELESSSLDDMERYTDW